MHLERVFFVLCVVTASLFLAGCATRSINHVLADPSRYANKEVRIQGSVTESYSVLGTGAYQVDDGTGRLWVFSKRGVPREGARVQVKGKIREGFSLGDLVKLPKQVESGLILIETSHKAKD
ncbi:MAG: hypothetical protein Kow001_23370 [Acidobacteriota bacterium]